MKKSNSVCNCNAYCARSICRSSDSGLMVKKCWCAECKEYRKEIKRLAYTITEVR